MYSKFDVLTKYSFAEQATRAIKNQLVLVSRTFTATINKCHICTLYGVNDKYQRAQTRNSVHAVKQMRKALLCSIFRIVMSWDVYRSLKPISWSVLIVQVC